MKKIYILFLACVTSLSFAQDISKDNNSLSSTEANGALLKAPKDAVINPSNEIGSSKTSADIADTYWISLQNALFNTYGGGGPFTLRDVWPDTLVKYRRPFTNPVDTLIRGAGYGTYNSGTGEGSISGWTGVHGMGQVLDPTSDIFNDGLPSLSTTVKFGEDRLVRVDSFTFPFFYHKYVDSTNGAKSSGTITVEITPLMGADTIYINGIALVEGVDFNAGNTNSETADSIANVINNGSLNSIISASVADSVITITALNIGVDGDTITLSYGDTSMFDPPSVTFSGATLIDGEDKRAIVDTMVIKLINSAGISVSATTGQSFMLYNPATHDVTSAGTITTIEVPLTNDDTSVAFNQVTNLSDASFYTGAFPTPVDIRQGQLAGIAIKYKPGVPYSEGDTMFNMDDYTGKLNPFALANFDETSNAVVLQDHDDYGTGNSGVFINKINLDGLDANWVPGIAFNPGGALHHINVAWRACPIGVLFTESTGTGADCRTVTFTDHSNFDPTQWQWNFGDGSSQSTEQNPVHTYEEAGEYTVTLQAVASGITGLTYSMEVEVGWCVNTEENDLKAQISMYPNPATDVVKISYTAGASQDLTITVLDLQGRAVYNQFVRNTTSFDNTIDVSNLASGTYMVKFENANGTHTESINIQ